jgi:N6-L-threonylcarbamoyladenine synthase
MAVADTLAEKTRRAIIAFRDIADGNTLAVAGGVAANQTIGDKLRETAHAQNVEFVAPPLKYCTDNGAMIAWAGLERFAQGECDDMTLAARPRWPLDQTATPMLGSGKKGAKA